MPEKYWTIVKDYVPHNDLSGKCDEFFWVAKNKQLYEGLITQIRKMKRIMSIEEKKEKW